MTAHRICRPAIEYSCGDGWAVDCGCNNYVGVPMPTLGQARVQLLRTHGFTPLPAEGCTWCGSRPTVDDLPGAHACPWRYYRVVFDRERQNEVFVCRDEPACRDRYQDLARLADEPDGVTSPSGLTIEAAARLREQYDLARNRTGALGDTAIGQRLALRDTAAGQRLCELLEHHMREGATLPQLAKALGKKPGHMFNMLVNLGLGELPVTGRARPQ